MERFIPTAFFLSFALVIVFGGELFHSSNNLEASTGSSMAIISADYPDITIEVNIPAAELRLKENGLVVRRFPVAVGMPQFPTPIREEHLTQVVWNPWWFPPNKAWAKDDKITPPGPKNPLGPVKMPMSDDVRVHGTTKDSSIGHAASHACIRMHNKDAKTLAWLLQSEFSDSIDPKLLEKYSAHGNTSFYVNLGRPIPIDFVYRPIEIEGGIVKLHNDWYHKIKNRETALLEGLLQAGVDIHQLSEDKLHNLVADWEKGRVEISLENLNIL